VHTRFLQETVRRTNGQTRWRNCFGEVLTIKWTDYHCCILRIYSIDSFT